MMSCGATATLPLVAKDNTLKRREKVLLMLMELEMLNTQQFVVASFWLAC